MARDQARLVTLCFAAALLHWGSITVAGASRPGIENARGHLEALTALGPRPSGSPANHAAAQYLVAHLEESGWQVRSSEGEGCHEGSGTCAWVRNVVAWLPSTATDPSTEGGGEGGVDEVGPGAAAALPDRAILFAAHYDSVPDGPGAADNAASVAVLLALAEELTGENRARPIVLLFTDGEERYLLGADLFVREDPFAERLAAVFNFDHVGRRPPLYAFETAPPNGALLASLAELGGFPGAPRPFSFATDVYRALPFDTDFTLLGALGAPGVNFAFARDGYAYHTAFDRPEGVGDDALAALLGTARGLARTWVVEGRSLRAEETHHALFFPVGPVIVRLPAGGAAGLAWGAALLGLLVAALLARRAAGPTLRGLAALLVALPLGLALLVALVAGLRALAGRGVVAYASPWPFLALLVVAGGCVLLLADRWLLGSRSAGPQRLAAAILLWSATSALAATGALASSAFFSLPLVGLVAVGGAQLLAGRRWLLILASALALGLALAAWAEPLSALVPFLVTSIAKAGPEPLVFWPLVAVILSTLIGSLLWGLAGVMMVADPAGSRAASWRRRALLAGTATSALLAAFVLLRPVYDEAHPQRVWAYHVSDGDAAYWALAAPDALPEVTGERGGERARHDLWWHGPGWNLAVQEGAPPGPAPVAHARREGGDLVVEVEPPPGADLVLLSVEGAAPADTVPASTARHRGRLLLRQVVAGQGSTRFHLAGLDGEEVRLRVMSTTVGFPTQADPPFTGELRGPVAVTARSVAYADVLPGPAVAPRVGE